MSAPEDRLLSDVAVERFAIEASAVLAGPSTWPVLEHMATAVIALTRDRSARLELMTAVGA